MNGLAGRDGSGFGEFETAAVKLPEGITETGEGEPQQETGREADPGGQERKGDDAVDGGRHEELATREPVHRHDAQTDRKDQNERSAQRIVFQTDEMQGEHGEAADQKTGARLEYPCLTHHSPTALS